MGRDAAAGRSTGRGDRGYEWVKRKDFSPPLCPHSRPEGLWNLTAVVRHKALACCPLHVPSPSPSSWAVSPHPETKMVIFFSLEPVFPQISGDAGSCCFHGNLPANLAEVELGSRPLPSACAACAAWF